jgi:hypothetical protein
MTADTRHEEQITAGQAGNRVVQPQGWPEPRGYAQGGVGFAQVAPSNFPKWPF